MKNVTIKKLSAVALAAVMAVSFAPVTSLTAHADLANSTTVTPAADGSGSITGIGNFLLSKDFASNATIKINPTNSGVVTLDLNGQTVIVELGVNVADDSIVLTDTDGIGTATGGHTYATLTISGTKPKVLSINGNMTVNRSTLIATDKISSIFVDDDQAVPVAITDSNQPFLVGNTVISNAAAAGSDIQALNGAVEVTGLTSGHKATVHSIADEATTLKATAAANTALTRILTSYTFYTSSSKGTGTGTFTDYKYYAGAGNGKSEIEKLPEITTSSSVAASTPKHDSGVTVTSIPSYSRAITVSTNGEPWITPITNTGVETDKQDTNTVFGLTYFTSDPSAYTTGTLAAIDGAKYVLGNAELAKVSEHSAKSSVKVIRGSVYNNGNKDSYDKFTVANGVTISAPADESVVENVQTDVTGNTTTVKKIVQVYGTGKAVDAAFAKPSGTVSKRNVNVAQVAQGATVAFTAANEVTVSRGSGVGYYSYTNTTDSAKTDYVFGATTVITNAFKNYVAPHTSNGLTIPAGIGTGKTATVFASKEIKTTVAGVEKTITIKGETNAKVTATSGNTQTWEVNADAKPVTANPVVTYRLYDRNRGEHLYTYSSAERDMLVKSGWKEEPSSIKVLPVSATEGVAIYRVYNPNGGGTHMYTQNPAEVQFLLNNGWKEGKIVFKTAESTNADAVPVYRLKNPNSKNGEHQFTTNAAERAMLINATWGDEGVAFYSFK